MVISGPEVLLIDRFPDKHYAIATINREERGNAMNNDLIERIGEAWVELRDDNDIWAVILTATGDRFFCSGADLKDRAERDATDPRGFLGDATGFDRLNPQSNRMWKPIIGAINGVAVAGGLYLAQICDVRI